MGNSAATNDYLIVWLMWIHFAFLLVPTIGIIVKIEYDEWREKHPRTIRLNRGYRRQHHVLRPSRI
jgi:hypothetical protein